MSAAGQSVSTLINTIRKSSFATAEEKVAGSKTIGLALWIDEIHDFKNLPDEWTETFDVVVFDPPHLLRAGETGWLFAKYGRLNDTWKEDLRKGFSECWRCLREGGTLIFKWNEEQIPVSEVLNLAPAKPLLGNRSGKKTHWIVFYKGN